MVSGLNVVTFGWPNPGEGDPEGFCTTVRHRLGAAAKSVHTTSDADVGTFGSASRAPVTFFLPCFVELIAELQRIGFGESAQM